jgi:hypothetical protein
MLIETSWSGATLSTPDSGRGVLGADGRGGWLETQRLPSGTAPCPTDSQSAMYSRRDHSDRLRARSVQRDEIVERHVERLSEQDKQ